MAGTGKQKMSIVCYIECHIVSNHAAQRSSNISILPSHHALSHPISPIHGCCMEHGLSITVELVRDQTTSSLLSHYLMVLQNQEHASLCSHVVDNSKRWTLRDLIQTMVTNCQYASHSLTHTNIKECFI